MNPLDRTRKSRPGSGGVLASLAALCLTALATISVPPHKPPESSRPLQIAGRTLDEWRDAMQQIDFRDPASAALTPGLVALVQEESAPWFTRRQAALTLGRLGPLSIDAVPVLVELLDAAGADPETAPPLWAIKALALYGPAAHSATSRLSELLNDPHAWLILRLAAVEALSQIARDHPPAVASLLHCLQREPQSADDAELQRAAIEALGFVGPAAGAAVPALARGLQHPDANLRREAATSLGRLGRIAEPALYALLECLATDDDAAAQDAAALALGQLGPGVAGDAVAALLADPDAELRQRVLTILAGWGPSATPWLASVQPLEEAESPLLRISALQAVWRITRNARDIAPKAASLLSAEDRQVRRLAVQLLTDMGPAAAPARSLLERSLHCERPEVRIAARKALEALSSPGLNDR